MQTDQPTHTTPAPIGTSAEEAQLIMRLQNPETRNFAFDQVVRSYQEMLYYHIRRIVRSHDDADDVLQNALMKAWRNIDKFRGDAQLKTWLYRIATNESLNHLRKNKKQNHQELANLEDNLQYSQQNSTQMSGAEIQQKLKAALATLPERQLLVFNMRYYDEMKYDQISEVLQVTVGALKASYHHAVKKIEKHLTSH